VLTAGVEAAEEEKEEEEEEEVVEAADANAAGRKADRYANASYGTWRGVRSWTFEAGMRYHPSARHEGMRIDS
jgi:hypothetical protein